MWVFITSWWHLVWVFSHLVFFFTHLLLALFFEEASAFFFGCVFSFLSFLSFLLFCSGLFLEELAAISGLFASFEGVPMSASQSVNSVLSRMALISSSDGLGSINENRKTRLEKHQFREEKQVENINTRTSHSSNSLSGFNFLWTCHAHCTTDTNAAPSVNPCFFPCQYVAWLYWRSSVP